MRGMLTSRRTSTYTVAHWDTVNNNSSNLDKHPANAPVCGRWSVVLCAVVTVVVRKKKKKLHSPQSRNTNGAVFTEATIVLLIFSPSSGVQMDDSAQSVCFCVFLRSFAADHTTEQRLQRPCPPSKQQGGHVHSEALHTQARTNSRVGAVRKVQMKIDACINEQNVSFVITFFVYLRRHIYRAMMVRVIPAPDRHTLSRLATQLQASQWGYD